LGGLAGSEGESGLTGTATGRPGVPGALGFGSCCEFEAELVGDPVIVDDVGVLATFMTARGKKSSIEYAAWPPLLTGAFGTGTGAGKLPTSSFTAFVTCSIWSGVRGLDWADTGALPPRPRRDNTAWTMLPMIGIPLTVSVGSLAARTPRL